MSIPKTIDEDMCLITWQQGVDSDELDDLRVALRDIEGSIERA